MSDEAILSFDKPHFQVSLYASRLEVDLKEGARKQLETLVESRPVLQNSLGWMFQTIIPLDARLSQIENVSNDPEGRVHIKIPGRRDIHISLEPAESRLLVDKMNELIPLEREKAKTMRQMASIGRITYPPPGITD